MDLNSIIEALRSTTVAEGQSQASDYLKKVSSIIGFPQLLLRIIQDEQLECAVRQAAVIYLKNVIYEHWEVDKDLQKEGKQWEMSEQDKAPLRTQIIPAILHSPEPIKVHLCTSIQTMMRNDFPERWPTLTAELLPLLGSQESELLSGGLLVLHRLCKIYEYKRHKEKTPLVEFMCHGLPILRERLQSLVPNQTVPSCFIQKQILKVLFCLVQFSLNTQMLPIEEYAKWLQTFLAIVQRPVPVECDAMPEEERAETLWWKCKKYGNKGNVDKPYTAFAEEYSKTYLLTIIESLLVHILNNYISGQFVSEYVLYLTITHLSDALNQAQVWQVVKPKAEILLKNVIFPLLQHSKEDEELWEEDREEFLRYKYDVYEDMHQPSAAASTLLQMITKRQGVMQNVLEFIMENLTPAANPHQVDGALHMIAVVSTQLLKSKKYKKDVEKLMDAHVTPRLSHQPRFVRMRACYVLHYASDTPYKNMKILERAVNALVHRLKEDPELPVKVEAAIAIQSLLNDQTVKVAPMIKPHIRDILIIVLRLVAETRVDDLPTVVDTLVENFEEDVVPIAYEVTVELVNIFNKMVTGGDDGDDQMVEDHSVGVMGILGTLETILGLLEEHPEIMKRIEPVVRSCIVSIFECYCESYFEEALTLTHTLIVEHISPEMWQVFDLICKAFDEEGTSFFSDCMPVFHAFVTVDTENFLAAPERVQKLLSICEKSISDDDDDENTKAHAAKMIEIFILQCQARINQLIPSILHLVFNQLQKPVDVATSLDIYRPQLLVVLIAALYCDFQLTTNIFGQIRMDPQLNTFEWFLRELHNHRDNFEGIHDRKMIIWLICRLLSDGLVPTIFFNQTEKLMEWLLVLFDDLQRCIKELAERSRDDDSSDDDDEDSEADDERMNGELKDSDDDVDEENVDYLEALEQDQMRRRQQRRSRRKSSTNKSMEDPTEHEGEAQVGEDSASETDSEDYHHFQEETDLEAFTTPVDEQDDKPGLNVFVLFKRTFEILKEHHPVLFSALCEQHQLGPEKMAELKALMDVCVREENLERSKQLAQSGGYAFDATQPVPNTFKFA